MSARKLVTHPIALAAVAPRLPTIDEVVVDVNHGLRWLADSWYSNGHFAFLATPPPPYVDYLMGRINIPPDTMIPDGRPIRLYLTSELGVLPDERPLLYFEQFSQEFGIALDRTYVELAFHHFGQRVHFFGFGQGQAVVLFEPDFALDDLRRRACGLIMPVECLVDR